MLPEPIVPELVIAEIFRLLLIFVRVGSAMVIMPGLAEAYVAARVRLLLALGLSLALFGPLAPTLPAVPDEPLALARLLAAEAVLGLFIGSAAKVIFAALHIAGTTIAFHSGLATAAIFDPSEATQGTLPGNFLTTTALVLLFVTDSHHLLVAALAASYATLPPGDALPWGDMAELLARLADRAFGLGLRLAAPMLLVSVLTYLAMGVLNRLMPAFQVFFIALPLQILAAFATVMLSFAAGLLAFFTFFEDGLASLGFGG
jgi:flagellar biosynthesis protein FliR